MTSIANIITTNPQSTGRRKDFVHYQSKAAFKAEDTKLSDKVKEQVCNELPNCFGIYVHESGQFLAITLYFGGKGIAKEARYKHIWIDARGEELQAEEAESIKLAKQAIRGALVPTMSPETAAIINKVEAEEDAKKAEAAAKIKETLTGKKPAAKKASGSSAAKKAPAKTRTVKPAAKAKSEEVKK